MRSMSILLVSLSITAFLLVSFCGSQGHGSVSQNPARISAVGDPEAVIEPLPDEVSNGTEVFLDGKNSTYSGGTIDHYEWKIFLHGVQKWWSTDSNTSFRFVKLGIYLITLTVTTNDSKTNMVFTAVYSISDSDSDGMQDWWEMRYFGNLTQGGAQDFDHDGYTNLQEYASGTNPKVKDPGPSLGAMIAENWYYLAAIAAVIVAAILIMYPRMKKKRKADVKKQIAAAIEIEKALEEDK